MGQGKRGGCRRKAATGRRYDQGQGQQDQQGGKAKLNVHKAELNVHKAKLNVHKAELNVLKAELNVLKAELNVHKRCSVYPSMRFHPFISIRSFFITHPPTL